MKTFSFICLTVSFFLYVFSFAAHMASFRAPRGGSHKAANGFLRAAFGVSTFYFIAEAFRHHYFLPVIHLPQALAFFAWAIAFVYGILFARAERDSFGLILTPLLFVLTGAACLAFPIESTSMKYSPNVFFAAHILSAFFAYACFTVSFAAGVLYLIQQHELKTHKTGTFYHRLPALEALEKLIFQPMILGAVLLFTAIVVGFLWSRFQFGEFWLTDPKTIATFFIVVAYSEILYLHYVFSMRGKRVVVFSLVAFGLMIFTFVGLRFVEGSHNFLQ